MGGHIPWTAGLLLTAALLAPLPAAADEWDNATDPDNGISTDNALFHGSVQVHDLATQIGPVADQDWSIVSLRPFSSYEVIVDGVTGDVLESGMLQRMDVNGNLVQSGPFEEYAISSLKWRTGAGSQPVKNYIRVGDAFCDLQCELNDRYRIRFYDTTYTVPRFNNTGSQTTALILQTTRATGCDIGVSFFRADGSHLATQETTLAGQSAVVLQTASVAGGQSGSIRILHTCGYGGLSGKAVALEPSTGFTFDTAIVPRPH